MIKAAETLKNRFCLVLGCNEDGSIDFQKVVLEKIFIYSFIQSANIY